jgi:hypothetical protein
VSGLSAVDIPSVQQQGTPLPVGTPGAAMSVPVINISTATAPTEFAITTDPVELLASYFNAINLQDYARAYGYWEVEPSGATLEQFSAGYAQTAYVEAFTLLGLRGGGAAGSIYVDIPTLVIASQDDGSQQIFVGCYIARKSNVPTGDNPEPDPNWHLYDGTLTAVASADLGALNNACENSPVQDVIDNRESPITLLDSYFSAIHVGDYVRAYGYWEQEPSGATLEEFSAGFAETAGVTVYLRLTFMMEGAAGSAYASIPGLVIAAQRDGSTQFYGGCYIARSSNVPVGESEVIDTSWRLYDANVVNTADLATAFAAMTCEQ